VKKYGNVFSLELGQSPVVVVSGLPLIKEMFTHLDQNFVNRFMTPVRERITGKNGKFLSWIALGLIIFDGNSILL
jgi:cytochrome P450 family 2 subfamily J